MKAKISSSALIAQLVELGNIKVWSLLVTVLGDLSADVDVVKGHGDRMPEKAKPISGSDLNQLFQQMGIKPEAVRVALHRLRKDGWVTSERDGRTSQYSLSNQGMVETRKVWRRVYQRGGDVDNDWRILVYRDALNEPDRTGLKIGQNTYLVSGYNDQLAADSARPDQFVVPINQSHVPEWVGQIALQSGTGEVASALASLLEQFEGVDERWQPLEELVFRSLVLHHWRRLALRDLIWFHRFAFEGGVAMRCHDAVHDVLEQLRRTELK